MCVCDDLNAIWSLINLNVKLKNNYLKCFELIFKAKISFKSFIYISLIICINTGSYDFISFNYYFSAKVKSLTLSSKDKDFHTVMTENADTTDQQAVIYLVQLYFWNT